MKKFSLYKTALRASASQPGVPYGHFVQLVPDVVPFCPDVTRNAQM
jgi:hypothetical protein